MSGVFFFNLQKKKTYTPMGVAYSNYENLPLQLHTLQCKKKKNQSQWHTHGKTSLGVTYFFGANDSDTISFLVLKFEFFRYYFE
jgi:hypothetical protein